MITVIEIQRDRSVFLYDSQTEPVASVQQLVFNSTAYNAESWGLAREEFLRRIKRGNRGIIDIAGEVDPNIRNWFKIFMAGQDIPF